MWSCLQLAGNLDPMSDGFGIGNIYCICVIYFYITSYFDIFGFC